MNIYIAAPWIHREAAKNAADLVRSSGHSITHDWWNHEVVEWEERSAGELSRQGIKDIRGVEGADAVILLNSAKSEGKAVEQGIAIALDIPIIAVGERGDETRNVFHYTYHYKWVKSIQEAIQCLSR